MNSLKVLGSILMLVSLKVQVEGYKIEDTHTNINSKKCQVPDEFAQIIQAIVKSTGLSANALTRDVCDVAEGFFQKVKTDYPRTKKTEARKVFAHIVLPAWVKKTLVNSQRHKFYGWGGK